MESDPQIAFDTLATELGIALKHRQWRITTAESCTGGWIAEALTAIAGSSDWFDRGFVTYSNQAKQDMLGMRATTLMQYGAVSGETAAEMVAGALHAAGVEVAVAVTGIAGPTGGTPAKPVGTVWFGFGIANGITVTEHRLFVGNRRGIRAQAVHFALQRLLTLVTEPATASE